MGTSPFTESGLFGKLNVREHDFVAEYERECLLVRAALDAEIHKAIRSAYALLQNCPSGCG